MGNNLSKFNHFLYAMNTALSAMLLRFDTSVKVILVHTVMLCEKRASPAA